MAFAELRIAKLSGGIDRAESPLCHIITTNLAHLSTNPLRAQPLSFQIKTPAWSRRLPI
jgi:hypothetical protein